ncbi:MAG: hypothetical protein KDH88_09890 [Chromatiales bacterium]|nr:hypothetical protein [Chromatiales bacterium]
MTQRQAKHAKQVVEHFQAMIQDEGGPELSEAHMDELTLMVESAISAALLEQMERFADQLERMAADVRKDAEHFG